MINYEEIQEKSLKHIKWCDEIFDGNTFKIQDKEFAYIQMRQLALELLEELKRNKIKTYFKEFKITDPAVSKR